jgi:hypothetical protein
MGKRSNAYNLSQKSLKHLVVNAKDLDVNERQMDRGHEYVDWVHEAEDRNPWRAREHCNKPSGSIKVGFFFVS